MRWPWPKEAEEAHPTAAPSKEQVASVPDRYTLLVGGISAKVFKPCTTLAGCKAQYMRLPASLRAKCDASIRCHAVRPDGRRDSFATVCRRPAGTDRWERTPYHPSVTYG